MCPKDTIYNGHSCVAKPERKVVGAGASCANSEVHERDEIVDEKVICRSVAKEACAIRLLSAVCVPLAHCNVTMNVAREQ